MASEAQPTIVPVVCTHQGMLELFDEIKHGLAVPLPMFPPGVHCKINRHRVTLRLQHYSVALLEVEGFYMDDGT